MIEKNNSVLGGFYIEKAKRNNFGGLNYYLF